MKRQGSAVRDGVALFKAIGLLVLAVPLVAAGSLVAAFLGHWIAGVPLWAVAAAAAWKSRPALVRELRLHDRESVHPVAALATGEDRRECPCCRYPTLKAGDDTCLLCDWPPPDVPDAADQTALRQARTNFAAHWMIHAPEVNPECAAPSRGEIELRRRLAAVYKRIRGGKQSAWFKARSLEDDLTALRNRRVTHSASG